MGSGNGLTRIASLMTHPYPFTIATHRTPSAPSFSPFLIVHPPPASAVSTAAMTTTQVSGTDVAAANLDRIFKQKKALRSQVRRVLKAMDPAQRSQEDNAIQKIVLEAPWFKSCRGLCAYISCSALREVDTSAVLSDILHNQRKDGHSPKRLYVPRVEDRNSHMRMLNISSVNDMITNSMNILEPAPVDADGREREDVMQAGEPVDLFLLPGLAFDKSGRRLGRGGGYYDTFLANYLQLAKERKWKPPLLIALSYSLQIMDEGAIPVTPADIPVDALVLPSGVIPISSVALERCS